MPVETFRLDLYPPGADKPTESRTFTTRKRRGAATEAAADWADDILGPMPMAAYGLLYRTTDGADDYELTVDGGI